MNPSNTLSIRVWCPDITDMSFEELVKAKPDLQCLDCRIVLSAKKPKADVQAAND